MLVVLGMNLRTNKSSKQQKEFVRAILLPDHAYADQSFTIRREERAIKVNGSIKARRLG
jgi:hypothetical protein